MGETPEYFARLIDEGNVTFSFYDPVHQPRFHRGYTEFQYEVSYRSSYQYHWNDHRIGRQLRIDPKIGRITYKLTNEVELPATLNHDRRWTNSLVKHEFDHVAMTLDPRVQMLIGYLCAATPEIVRDLPAGTEVNNEVIDRIIHETVEPRYQTVLQLLIANQNDFDAVSRHGWRDVPDRRAYFESLFTEPNLKQQKFPYLEEVKPLLIRTSYRKAKLPYRFQE